MTMKNDGVAVGAAYFGLMAETAQTRNTDEAQKQAFVSKMEQAARQALRCANNPNIQAQAAALAYEEIAFERLRLLEDIASIVRENMRADADEEAYWTELYADRPSFDDVLGV